MISRPRTWTGRPVPWPNAATPGIIGQTRTQFVISLVIGHPGDPIYWQVRPGNTLDVTTVQPVVADLQTRLGLGPSGTLAFDRAMVSAKNLAAITAAGHTYLSAMDRETLGGLGFWPTPWPDAVTEDSWRTAGCAREMQAYDKTARALVSGISGRGASVGPGL